MQCYSVLYAAKSSKLMTRGRLGQGQVNEATEGRFGALMAGSYLIMVSRGLMSF